MEKSLINASLSTESLTFLRGGSPATFEVIVNNDSEQFANFQLEISAPGENRNSNYSWYKLSPEIAAAQPHGSSTQFQVSIIDTPIPGFVGIVNLTIKVFSPQLRQQRRLLLRLKIEPDGSATVLKVELPVRDFQVYPHNTVDIPVRVRNLGQQTVNVALRFLDIDPLWLIGGIERRLLIDPGSEAEVTYQCQPPSVVLCPSRNYPFTVKATGHNSLEGKGEANLEVLPIGFVEFSVKPVKQKIPTKGKLWIDWKSDTATFELRFKNTSNLKQQVNIILQGRDWRQCTFEIIPQDADISIGSITKVLLNVKTKRPVIGMGKNLLLEAKTELFDQRLGSTDPATKILELEVAPIIPLWLQLAILALLAALLALLLQPTPVSHLSFVNSVRLNGDVSSVASASDDCNLRRWRVDTNLFGVNLEPLEDYISSPIVCIENKKPQKQGLFAIVPSRARTLQFRPESNDILATGLDNNIIQIWNVRTRKMLQQLGTGKNEIGGQVFDLAYKKNSTKLFSGHSSGEVRVWSAPRNNSNFQQNPEKVIDLQELQKNQLKLGSFQVRALSLSPDEKTLAIAGSFRRFLLWHWEPSQTGKQLQKFSLGLQKFENKEKLEGNTGQDSYVYGLAFAPTSPGSNTEILATSDSSGLIAIWDLRQCKPNQNPSSTNKIVENKIVELDCPLIHSWKGIEEGKSEAIRSLKFAQEESDRLLVSGGDDGRVMAWYLTEEYKLDKAKSAYGKQIYQSPKKINSIDVKTNKQGGIVIVSGDDDFQVKLHRLK
jgi:WD40 repeat protein